MGAWMENSVNDEGDPPVTNSGREDVAEQLSVNSGVVLSTRTSRAWMGLLPTLALLILILVFVFQNAKNVRVRFFALSGSIPLSVALLGALILGAVMVLALGSARIIQLRRQIHRKSVHRGD